MMLFSMLFYRRLSCDKDAFVTDAIALLLSYCEAPRWHKTCRSAVRARR